MPRLSFFILCSLLLLSGCGGGSTTTPPPGPTPGPVTTTPTLDDPRAVTVVVDPATGGTATATDASGATFELAVPPGALTVPTELTMTPLAGMAGVPYSNKAVHAVQIEPTDLFFGRAATLSITPPAPIPTPLPFRFEPATAAAANRSLAAGSHEFWLTTANLDCGSGGAAKIEISLHQAGGAGTGTWTGSDGSILQAHSPAAYCAQMEQEVEALILTDLVAEGGCVPNPTRARVPAALELQYDGLVKGALQAGTDPDNFDQALELYYCWRALLAFIGDAGNTSGLQTRSAEGLRLASAAANAIIPLAPGRCATHDLKAAGQLLDIAALLEAGFLETGTLPNLNRTTIFTTYRDCMHFRVTGTLTGHWVVDRGDVAGAQQDLLFDVVSYVESGVYAPNPDTLVFEEVTPANLFKTVSARVVETKDGAELPPAIFTEVDGPYCFAGTPYESHLNTGLTLSFSSHAKLIQRSDDLLTGNTAIVSHPLVCFFGHAIGDSAEAPPRQFGVDFKTSLDGTDKPLFTPPVVPATLSGWKGNASGATCGLFTRTLSETLPIFVDTPFAGESRRSVTYDLTLEHLAP